MDRVLNLSGHFKSEFRKRLVALRDSINFVLELDDMGLQYDNTGNLFPHLFQLLSYMWSFQDHISFLRIKGIRKSK